MILPFSDTFPWKDEAGNKVPSGFAEKTKASFVVPHKGQTKCHTIRSGSRWKPGNKIHFVYGNRTPQQITFLEGTCTKVDNISIYADWNKTYGMFVLRCVVNGVTVSKIDLAKNDGLTLEEFHRWFVPYCAHEPFHGQIIHWTNDIEY